MPAERSRAFAPGRVNLIGEHTDYNLGLALPFAISQGIAVEAVAVDGDRVRARAADLGEDDDFPLARPAPAAGWRAFVRGAVAELSRAGRPPPAARLLIAGDLPRGAGLSSSAALEVALILALLALAGGARIPRWELAGLCSRVEKRWAGAHSGLLDQLASLFGQREHALLIDFAAREIAPVPLRLDGWRLVVLDSGERHSIAGSGYNERAGECARACRLLGVPSLRDARRETVADLPEPLRSRAAHVIGENERVRLAVAALRDGNLPAVGGLLDASHESLRDLYEVSTPAVEAARMRLLDAGASGARIVGGGFGGSVLALFAPGLAPPEGAREVRPGPSAHLLADDCPHADSV